MTDKPKTAEDLARECAERIGRKCLGEELAQNSDNIAIMIATYYEDHPDRPANDPDDDDHLGWGKWVMEQSRSVEASFHAIVGNSLQPLINKINILETALNASSSENDMLRDRIKELEGDRDREISDSIERTKACAEAESFAVEDAIAETRRRIGDEIAAKYGIEFDARRGEYSKPYDPYDNGILTGLDIAEQIARGEAK